MKILVIWDQCDTEPQFVELDVNESELDKFKAINDKYINCDCTAEEEEQIKTLMCDDDWNLKHPVRKTPIENVAYYLIVHCGFIV